MADPVKYLPRSFANSERRMTLVSSSCRYVQHLFPFWRQTASGATANNKKYSILVNKKKKKEILYSDGWIFLSSMLPNPQSPQQIKQNYVLTHKQMNNWRHFTTFLPALNGPPPVRVRQPFRPFLLDLLRLPAARFGRQLRHGTIFSREESGKDYPKSALVLLPLGIVECSHGLRQPAVTRDRRAFGRHRLEHEPRAPWPADDSSEVGVAPLRRGALAQLHLHWFYKIARL